MAKSGVEREVKFLIREKDVHPKYIDDPSMVNYLQAYLPKESEEVNSIVRNQIPDIDAQMQGERIETIRIRRQGGDYVLAVKGPRKDEGTIEIEQDISKEVFDELLSKSNGSIEKDRLTLPLYGELEAEIDFYRGRFQGVVSIEVEFDDSYSKYQVELAVSSTFPGSVLAQDDVLTAGAMAGSASLEEFIDKVKSSNVGRGVIKILEDIGKQ